MRTRQIPAESKSIENQIQIAFNATPDFRDWLGDLAESLQLTKAATLTQGLMLLAASKGFRPPPLRAPSR